MNNTRYIITYKDKVNKREVSTNSEIVANLFIKQLHNRKSISDIKIKVNN